MKVLVFIFGFLPAIIFAQSCGEIKGVIYTEDSIKVISYARLKLVSLSDTFEIYSSLDGEFSFKTLKPNLYELYIKPPELCGKIYRNLKIDNDTINLLVYVQDLTIEITCKLKSIGSEYIDSLKGLKRSNLDYYIDGVKTCSNRNLPGTQIKIIPYYLGGISANFEDKTSVRISKNMVSYFDLYYQWKSEQ